MLFMFKKCFLEVDLITNIIFHINHIQKLKHTHIVEAKDIAKSDFVNAIPPQTYDKRKTKYSAY